MNLKIKGPAALTVVTRRLKAKGKKIVFTNGCFDIIHAGHVKYLQRAKRLGDILVVAINSDSSVKTLKGKGRPVNKQSDRALVVSYLEFVDYVTIFSGATPERLIRRIKPDLLVKGGDWKAKDIVGGEFVSSYGGKVVSLPFIKGQSTTSILEKIMKL